MKRVSKSLVEPKELADYRNRWAARPNPPTWNEFKGRKHESAAVRSTLRSDQRGLCAYCEVKLSPGNESVEHIIPRATDHSRELDWQNLLLVCCDDERTPPPKEFSCGHARNFAGSPPVINPLEIPAAERLFVVESRTGKLNADVTSCDRAGIAVQLVQSTIGDLGLSASRLSRARLRILETIDQQITELVAKGLTFEQAEHQLVEEQFLPN